MERKATQQNKNLSEKLEQLIKAYLGIAKVNNVWLGKSHLKMKKVDISTKF